MPRDIERLAAMILRRRAEYDRRHRRRFATDSTTSRILNRERKNPGVFTLRRIANKLETTVGDLLNEPVLGEAHLQKLREFVDFLIDRFDLTGARAAAEREEKTFAVEESEFVERDYDYPRPHHVWIVPNAKAAAGGGIESEFEGDTTEVLHSIRDVYNGDLRVIRVIGNSMDPVLRNNDKVIIDTRRQTPNDGDVVAVYHHIDGGILGYWRSDRRGDLRLEKENQALFDPIPLDRSGGWTLWGIVTRIVDTPVNPKPRRR